MHKNKNNMRYWLYKSIAAFFGSDEVAPYLGSGSSYLVYTAYVNQPNSATNNIVPVVFQNTLGEATWSRTGVGTYRLTIPNAFTSEKTFFSLGDSASAFSSGLAIIDYNDTIVVAHFSGYRVNASVFEFVFNVRVSETDSQKDDIYTWMGAAGGLPIEIRVYP